jgi:hypothetical protein
MEAQMDAELNHRLNYELKLLKDERIRYTRRLEQCRGFEDVVLRKTKRQSGKYYYYAKRAKSDKFVYLGVRDRPDVIRICEVHFLKESLRRIERNINLINSFLDGYLPYDIYTVNAALPSTYRSKTLPLNGAYEAEGARWKAKKLEYQAQQPENYPEFKTETTSDGVKVKTVSELLLYEKFKDAGFIQIYELPLALEDHGPLMYPDITILSPVDMKTEIYVEYVGRLDLPDYQQKFARRINRYIKNGFKPNVNVFFIYSDKEGHVDSMQINKVIADIRGI